MNRREALVKIPLLTGAFIGVTYDIASGANITLNLLDLLSNSINTPSTRTHTDSPPNKPVLKKSPDILTPEKEILFSKLENILRQKDKRGDRSSVKETMDDINKGFQKVGYPVSPFPFLIEPATRSNIDMANLIFYEHYINDAQTPQSLMETIRTITPVSLNESISFWTEKSNTNHPVKWVGFDSPRGQKIKQFMKDAMTAVWKKDYTDQVVGFGELERYPEGDFAGGGWYEPGHLKISYLPRDDETTRRQLANIMLHELVVGHAIDPSHGYIEARRNPYGLLDIRDTMEFYKAWTAVANLAPKFLYSVGGPEYKRTVIFQGLLLDLNPVSLKNFYLNTNNQPTIDEMSKIGVKLRNGFEKTGAYIGTNSTGDLIKRAIADYLKIDGTFLRQHRDTALATYVLKYIMASPLTSMGLLDQKNPAIVDLYHVVSGHGQRQEIEMIAEVVRHIMIQDAPVKEVGDIIPLFENFVSRVLSIYDGYPLNDARKNLRSVTEKFAKG